MSIWYTFVTHELMFVEPITVVFLTHKSFIMFVIAKLS